MPARQYLTVEDVAARHRRSPRTVRDWITHGCVTPGGRIRLEAIRAGKKYSVESEDLEIFEARLRHGSSRPDLDMP
ncbi:helix-turn-helix domain-containing protein [uncultured Amaricoccus sp.]|uniref:helix-turn-helix domain-containing protein n=1 Tax=uncultured Amaricoccus sp. TaxID=339341 RepID=UPI0026160099|nr:helix-turn-helix domain-containing protein [uncultured Amaricoccus sp.]